MLDWLNLNCNDVMSVYSQDMNNDYHVTQTQEILTTKSTNRKLFAVFS